VPIEFPTFPLNRWGSAFFIDNSNWQSGCQSNSLLSNSILGVRHFNGPTKLMQTERSRILTFPIQYWGLRFSMSLQN
jgi:hypothetical protein